MDPLEQSDLASARYVLLRSFRGDGTAVDTPIWFAVDGHTLLFRTKVGPKTKRLNACRDVQLTPCDYRGRPQPGRATIAGRAAILAGAEAEHANAVLHKRYGWQWNIVPLIKIPGVRNVHQELCVREKLRRARHRGVWPDSVIVRVDLL
ncbi:PPOX class F420-dependent oxidoreductase [Mycobacterium sp. 1423905.2]|uniref:PPOX class F420-dependent oxidoreductase n=1 Tax=Mycobacterium sp. 1423905.2 TaxID=1856859 RepID=UPI00080115D2|nr:PPOX class F420-dependent oxidoreductase [Mycobacterium sp. 1423905.2]OBJ60347.1 PPOX class F420-dependent enzyme [Mycobacterium sp. 1423905.2]